MPRMEGSCFRPLGLSSTMKKRAPAPSRLPVPTGDRPAMYRLSLLAVLALTSITRADSPGPVDARAVEHFEKHVRPVLIDKCVRCHGPKQQRGGLRLDSRAALLRGGDNGPALVAGQPDKSP